MYIALYVLDMLYLTGKPVKRLWMYARTRMCEYASRVNILFIDTLQIAEQPLKSLRMHVESKMRK